ncbi:MAG: bifunctional phosphopantothenoylcysteine decarboxylase/phosphopantothenate--cysteine ligase CoaBC [Methanobacteriaceae archaeon]|jgi:phosphopantothenoylcysteine decarboxylase/phosphopantothenate--cysteine ligase|nr:bifunctional phosphopantothenoylcysteine decarboxylase/phosphopantothenate--cysteine ligase CoaBC [Candidatus Methanorudis spinitermitis]
MNIVLCVTGSIAATESIKLARELRRYGADVKCFMSDGACKIIHPNAMEFATGQKVVTELTGNIEHVKYSQTDLILVAPATANVISKFTYKIADNPINSLLITAYGYDTPILFVPSMHDAMYKTIAFNIETLKKKGIYFVNPRMEESKAKFPKKEDIVLESLRAIGKNKDLKNKKVLISLGRTYEAIDPIRGISNKSSGKMGLALAKEAFIRGADLKLIAGKVDVDLPKSFEVVFAESSKEMNDKTKELVGEYDIFIATAAVSDFAPIEKKSSKISSSFDLSLKFKPTEKIIKQIKDINPKIFLVGFKAEYNISDDEMIKLAKKQIKTVGTDLVVANDVSVKSCGFGSDNNEVILINNETFKIKISSKKEIANIIFDKIYESIKQ